MYADWKKIFNRLNKAQRLELTESFLVHINKTVNRRSLRPIDLLFPAMLAQAAVFIVAFFLEPEKALFYIVIGNFAISGLAMLPALRIQNKPPHWV